MRNLVLNLRSCQRKAKNIRKERTVAWTKGSRKKYYLLNVRRRLITRQDLCVCMRILVALFGLFRCPAKQILTSNECLLLFFFPFLFPPSKPYSTIPFWFPKVEASSFFSLLRRGQQTYMHASRYLFLVAVIVVMITYFFGPVSDRFFFSPLITKNK